MRSDLVWLADIAVKDINRVILKLENQNIEWEAYDQRDHIWESHSQDGLLFVRLFGLTSQIDKAREIIRSEPDVTYVVVIKVDDAFEIAGRGTIVTSAADLSKIQLGIAHQAQVWSSYGRFFVRQAFKEFARTTEAREEQLFLRDTKKEELPKGSVVGVFLP